MFVAYYAEDFSHAWMGLGCVLTAVPILASADAVARVFQQRTGDLARPLPWSILTPLALGLVLSAVGVCLSGVGLFEGRPPYALVPTAAVAAVLMAIVARRTQQQAFVWAMLVLLTVAYRFLPVFFAETARLIIDSSATAIHESRLPWAFYGFTFLPLLAALTAGSCWAQRRGHSLFAVPMRQFVLTLGMLFLAMTPTHAKALFPAGITLAAVFAAQAFVFRNRAISIPAVIASLLAAAGLPVFFNGVVAPHFGFSDLPPTAWFSSLSIAAALLAMSFRLDRRLNTVPWALDNHDSPMVHLLTEQGILRIASLVTTAFLMLAWIGFVPASVVEFLGGQIPGLAAGGTVAALSLVHAFLALKRPISLTAWAFANLVAMWVIGEHHLSISRVINPFCLAVLVLLAQWMSSYVLAMRPERRISRAFAEASRIVSMYGLFVAAIPFFIVHAIATFEFVQFTANVWATTVLLLVWAIDAARRQNDRFLGTVALVGMFIVAGSATMATFGLAAMPWLPTVAVVVSAIIIAATTLLHHRGITCRGITAPAEIIAPLVLTAVAIVSPIFFTTPMFVAGILAPLALIALLGDRKIPLSLQLPAVALNWRLIGLIVPWIAPQVRHLFQVFDLAVVDLCLPVALMAAASVLLWTVPVPSRPCSVRGIEFDVGDAHRFLLRTLIAYLLAAMLTQPALDAAQIAMVLGIFGVLAATEIRNGIRFIDERRIWIAEALGATALSYLALFRVFDLHHGMAMYVVLAVGLMLWFIGKLSLRRPTTAVMAGPFCLTGRAMPLVAVGIAIFRHVWLLEICGVEPQWLGCNSLAILLAAAFYFWQGLETQIKHYKLLAAAILNVAIILLWRDLRLTDPQFYMIPIGISILWLVELLQNEIPTTHHTPLRYLGALVILVSPTFNIVQGSWLHLFSLMVVSVAVILVAMGLRVRALIYTGTAFLAADLVAMVVRGSIDRPQVLWASGLALGASIVALGAICELRREHVLQRVRAVASALESWR